MSLTHRSNTVFATAADGKFLAGAGSVVVLPAGGVVATASGDQITLYSGHGFSTGDKFMVGTDTGTFSGLYTVVVSGNTLGSVPEGATFNVATGDRLVNLGPDSGTSTPNFDNSTVLIYSTPDTSVLIEDSTITLNSDGGYEYWHDGASTWELFLGADGAPVGLEVDTGLDDVEVALRQDPTRYVDTYATGGAGTTASPWTGWETAFASIPSTGAEIVFRVGEYSKTADIDLPVNLTGWLHINAQGGATVTLTSGSPRLFDIADHSDYDTLRFIDIAGFAINAASLTGSNHVLIGTDQAGVVTTRQRLNYANIRIRDIRMYNVSDTGPRTGIKLNTQHPAGGETATTCTDILIENIRQEGGANCVVLTGGTDNTDVNMRHTFQRITIRNLYHASATVPTAFVATANIQLGQDAHVKDSIVEGCWLQNSGDVGIEVDNPDNVCVRNCTSQDAFATGFYATNFNSEVVQGSNSIVFDNCHAKVVSATSTTGSLLTGFGVLGSSTIDFGRATIRRSSYSSLDSSIHRPLTFLRAPKFLTIDGFDVYLATPVSTTGTDSLIPVRGPQSDTVIRARDIHVAATVNANNLNAVWIVLGIDLEDGYFDVDGVYVSWAWTNNGHATGAGLQLVALATGLAYGVSAISAQDMQGSIRNVALQSFSGPPTTTTVCYGINVGTSVASSYGIAVSDCDFSNFPALSNYVAVQSGADRVSISFRDIATVENPNYHTAASAATLTMPPTGDVIAVSGTTGITNISGASWNGRVVTLRFTDAVSGLTVTDGGNLKINGDLVTGTAGNTTLTLFYDGTNYVEKGRSIN